MIRSRVSSTRRGFTLYELLVAITIGTTVLMAATSLIHNALQWTKLSHHRRLDDQTAFLLSRQFRDDVHRAADAVVTDRQLKLLFRDDTQVIYRIVDDVINRTADRDDAETAMEFFPWKQSRQCDFRIEDGQVILEVSSRPNATENAIRPWRVVRAGVALRLKHQDGEIDP